MKFHTSSTQRTVRELIEELEEFDPDLPIVIIIPDDCIHFVLLNTEEGTDIVYAEEWGGDEGAEETR